MGTTLKHRAPSGLVTPASRGPCRIHPVLDNAVCWLDAEEIPRGDFDGDLRADMECRPLADLVKQYPEMTFTTVAAASTKRPKGHDKAVYIASKGVWRCADWRRAPKSPHSQ